MEVYSKAYLKWIVTLDVVQLYFKTAAKSHFQLGTFTSSGT